MTDPMTDTAWARERAEKLAAEVDPFGEFMPGYVTEEITAALNEADERATARTRAEERALAAEAREYAGKLEEAGGLGWRVRAKAAEAALAAAHEMQEKAVAAAVKEEEDIRHEQASRLLDTIEKLCVEKGAAEAKLARLKAPDEALQSCFVVYESAGVLAAFRALAAYLETPPEPTSEDAELERHLDTFDAAVELMKTPPEENPDE